MEENDLRNREEDSDISSSNEDEPTSPQNSFVCPICMETPKRPVVTPCGHMFCWVCIGEWMEMGHNTCPKCKGKVTKENVIPVYGLNEDEKDPREEPLPPRPESHREPEPEHSQQFPNFGFFPIQGQFGNTTFYFSFGGFPIIMQALAIFGNSIYRWWTNSRTTHNAGNPQNPPNAPHPNGNDENTFMAMVTIIALILLSFLLTS